MLWKRATTRCNLHVYLRANKRHGQRSTYPTWKTGWGLERVQLLQRMPDSKQERPECTGKTPYCKVQRISAYKSFLDGSDATSAIRIRKIFNTGCRDAKRQRNEDLIFPVRTQKGWTAWQSTLCRGGPVEKNCLLGPILRFLLAQGNELSI